MTILTDIPGVRVDLGINDGNVAIIEFEGEDSSRVEMGSSFLELLHDKLEIVSKNHTLRGLILQSKTHDHFSSGHDIQNMLHLKAQPGKLEAYHARANLVLDLLESLEMPTFALIEGCCMGAGAELILACDYRLGTPSPKTVISFHDIQRGVPPAWGASFRLPRVVGFRCAVDLLITGTILKSSEALSLGLLDGVCEPDLLLPHAMDLAQVFYRDKSWKSRRQTRTQPVLLSHEEMELIAPRYLAKNPGMKLGQLACSKLTEINQCQSAREWDQMAQEAFMAAWDSKTCAHLLELSVWASELERDIILPPGELAPMAPESAAIIGSGMIGPAIAAVFTRQKIQTILIDRAPFSLGQGTTSIIEELQIRLRGQFVDMDQAFASMGRLSTSTVMASVGDRNFAIEAVVESEETKVRVLKEISNLVPRSAVIASNTATMSISRLAREVQFPDKFAGMHFIPPVDKCPLVEIVRGEKTSDWTVASLVKLARKAGKIPIIVNDSPGFVVSRMALPWVRQASQMVLEGVSPYLIDEVMIGLGFERGVFRFKDMAGIETMYFTNLQLEERLGNRFPPPALDKVMVDAGRLGKKVGQGFYNYTNGQKPTEDPSLHLLYQQQMVMNRPHTIEEITERLLLALLLEGYRVLEEKVAPMREVIDFAIVHGLGFPKNIGGIFHWACDMGEEKIRELLSRYRNYGNWFIPCGMLESELQTSFQKIRTNLI